MTCGAAQARLELIEKLYVGTVVINNNVLKFEPLPVNHDYFGLRIFDTITNSYYDQRGDFKNHIINLNEINVSEVLNVSQVTNADNPILLNFTQSL